MMTGVILAGGLNRRMDGKLKALLQIGEEPLLLKQLLEMSLLCKQVLIVTNVADALSPVVERFRELYHGEMDIHYIHDRFVQAGPLGGLHAACLTKLESLMWVVGCDMPLVSAAAAKAMGERCLEAGCKAVIPVIEGRVHPLHGIYSPLVGAAAGDLLTQGNHRLMGLLDQIDWIAVEQDFFMEKGISVEFVMNLNTPEAYLKFLTGY
ncbi:molybdenum cofactor guanylyltransferase [Paenibacillus sp. SYP-B3998]|uniref:Molybdenum cofactor guanylyltransferase n=1 Tax=Paenibacillus sp. SYP-B3998 TaxID=2678564 RepID=A0A6G4A640_9BACL|nr:molybdenum cofactor guanylyltransferase [Paenibacillus sp. SYP-B3998]NEW09842.1 molybdenum cofactor guanylyltransferase [Paenibacillus sp. SYP-B3998]